MYKLYTLSTYTFDVTPFIILTLKRPGIYINSYKILRKLCTFSKDSETFILKFYHDDYSHL